MKSSAYSYLRGIHRAREINTGTARGLTHQVVKISDEIKDALHRKQPIVALESTIYTHGATIFVWGLR